MNSRSLFLFLLLICSRALHAQTPSAISSAPTHPSLDDKNAPRFKFDGGDTHDFGKVPDGPEAIYFFRFKNIGKQPLMITMVNTSSGGTVADWNKEPVLPGKKGQIKITFYTAGRRGQSFERTISIFSNAASEKSFYELRIKGEVVAAADLPTH